MNFIQLIKTVIVEEKKKRKRKKTRNKNNTSIPYGYWGPWGLPGYGYSDTGVNGDTGVGDSGGSET
jgi:hypothetical protein